MKAIQATIGENIKSNRKRLQQKLYFTFYRLIGVQSRLQLKLMRKSHSDDLIGD
jgi:hypothetical protein